MHLTIHWRLNRNTNSLASHAAVGSSRGKEIPSLLNCPSFPIILHHRVNNHLGWFSNDTGCLGREELMDTADDGLALALLEPRLAAPCSSSCSLARCLPPAQLPHFMSGHMSRHRNLSWPSCPLSWSAQFTVPDLSSSSLPKFSLHTFVLFMVLVYGVPWA